MPHPRYHLPQKMCQSATCHRNVCTHNCKHTVTSLRTTTGAGVPHMQQRVLDTQAAKGGKYMLYMAVMRACGTMPGCSNIAQLRLSQCDQKAGDEQVRGRLTESSQARPTFLASLAWLLPLVSVAVSGTCFCHDTWDKSYGLSLDSCRIVCRRAPHTHF